MTFALASDLGRAVRQLGDPRFLGALAKAVAVTLVALTAVFWAVVAGLGWLLPDTISLPWVGAVPALDTILSWAAIVALLGLSVILMVPAAAAAVGFFLEDVAAAVEARYYPGLPAVTPQPLAQQVGESLRFLGLVMMANLGALVIYLLVPPLAPVIFWMVNGYLLGREYFTLVALRRLGRDRAEALRRQHALRIWALGTAMAVPLSLPILNLIVPLIGVAVFTHQVHRLAPQG